MCVLVLVDADLRILASSAPLTSSADDVDGTPLESMLDQDALETVRQTFENPVRRTLRVTSEINGEQLETECQLFPYSENESKRLAILFAPSGNESYKLVFAHAPVGLFSLDTDGRLLEANQAALDILDRSRSEVIGAALVDFLAPGYRRRHRSAVKRLSRTGKINEVDYSVTRSPDDERDVVISANAERDENNRIIKVVGSMVDVTERREIERAYRLVDQRYKLLFDRNLAGVFRCTLDGRVFECNEAFARILGFRDRADFFETGHSDLYVDEEEQRSLYRRLRQRRSLFGIELALKKRDGEPIWTLQNLSLIARGESEDPIVEGTLFDITERRIAQEQVQYQALHDALTGLPNPRLFTNRVGELIASASEKEDQAAVLFVDLDGFKTVNDTMGHAVGNELLQLIALRLQKVLRANDIVSRMGGDEFTVGAIVNGAGGAEILTRKILAQIARPFLLRGRNIYVTASIGVALAPENGNTIDDLLKAADIAMYHAKEGGRNRYVISSSSSTNAAVTRMELESDLHRALDQEEFELYYQPLVVAETGEVIGVEALIRWHHPERGLLLPDEFIPLAERSGLILAIGEWVLDTSLVQLKRWLAEGIDTRVAVNISPRQFRSETFAEEVSLLLERHEVEASRLELEVTESMAMDNPEAALRTLTKLKRMGVRISIDDFGTGYSSLSYLTRFPVDTIKIDRIFIQEISEDNSESAIISAVIALARELDLEVVAEGVENQEQSNFLRREACQKLQGYFYGHPCPQEQIITTLAGLDPGGHSTS